MGLRPPVGLAMQGDRGGPLESKDALGFSIKADLSDRQLIQILEPSFPRNRRVLEFKGMVGDGSCKPSEGTPFEGLAL